MLEPLERRHDVLAPSQAGHAGGPELATPIDEHALVEAIETAMDDAGFETAHVVGNSLGGYVALQLASRGRARSVVALAPAGGWAPGDDTHLERLDYFATTVDLARQAVPYADQIVSTPEGRRRVTEFTTVRYDHIPAELLANSIRGVAACSGAGALIERARRGLAAYPLDFERISCPVRIVWGTEDRLLEWPGAAVRYREALPDADWVKLPGVGHCPQLDVPAQTAELILEWTGG